MLWALYVNCTLSALRHLAILPACLTGLAEISGTFKACGQLGSWYYRIQLRNASISYNSVRWLGVPAHVQDTPIFGTRDSRFGTRDS
eukprot:3555397-Pyramimonas_sp.AAC.1